MIVALLLGLLVAVAGCRPGQPLSPSPTPGANQVTGLPAVASATATRGAAGQPPPAIEVGQTPTATETRVASPPATIRPSATPTPQLLVPPDLMAPRHLMVPYTIAGLRQADFPGGAIQLAALPDEGDGLSRYTIRYPSPGPSGTVAIPHVSGLMIMPDGPGPFPVIILLHGYYDRDYYWSGAGTWQAAEYLAQRGYLAVIPDYRSWGQSDSGLSLFHTGLVADTLNLISSLATVPQADPDRIGLWGHSMGGGVATKVLAADNRVRAAVLYAPNSADDADLVARWGPGCLPGQSEAAGDNCNPAEVIPVDTSPELVDAYLTAAADPIMMQQIAPIYHLETIVAPLQIHIGTADGQGLAETPPDWSEKLFLALQDAGKPVDYFVYQDQGHFFVGQSWSLLMERSATFFDRHLGQ